MFFFLFSRGMKFSHFITIRTCLARLFSLVLSAHSIIDTDNNAIFICCGFRIEWKKKKKIERKKRAVVKIERSRCALCAVIAMCTKNMFEIKILPHIQRCMGDVIKYLCGPAVWSFVLSLVAKCIWTSETDGFPRWRNFGKEWKKKPLAHTHKKHVVLKTNAFVRPQPADDNF